ncbi:MAG: ADP-forming succinate--CoA ligase subunit beta [Myxococcota bacterium]
MKAHEYQSKALFAKYGIAVPEGIFATTKGDVKAAAEKLGFPVVLKAQVHAGGRGKGGGIKLVKNGDELEKGADALIGKRLVTPQTGAEGQPISGVLVEKASKIDKELYVGLVVDRSTASIAIMASTEGGVEIEKVAAETPEKIITAKVCPTIGFSPYIGRNIGFALGLSDKLLNQFVKLLGALYRIFVEKNCSLVEINPLIVSGESLVALDAKINFDDAALFKMPDVLELRDKSQEDARECEASEWDLNYISLTGNVGCMVNGAGLAMATMDIIKQYGGMPANFLDVGGSATPERVEKAFHLILSDKNVKSILVNIFGGIVRCDVVAQGIIEATKKAEVKIPIVVRLQGTKFEEGRKLLKESGLNIIPADTMEDAAKKAVTAARG